MRERGPISETRAANVDTFATLFKMAERCDYGTLKDELIRDRLVVGSQDVKLSERPQLVAELTL